MQSSLLIVFFTAFGLASTCALAGEKENTRATLATEVLRTILSAPDSTIPERLLRNAEAIAVVPDVVKAGLVIGGRRGKGVISVKNADGSWSNPSFIKVTGGSFGFQAGVQSSDIVLVFRTRRGVDSIVNGKFTLGADAAVAAGPLGRQAQAMTDAQLKAEIYSYSRSRGLFAGIALDGSVISIDHGANRSTYGANITPRRVFEGPVSNVPTAVVDFRDALEEYTAQ